MTCSDKATGEKSTPAKLFIVGLFVTMVHSCQKYTLSLFYDSVLCNNDRCNSHIFSD